MRHQLGRSAKADARELLYLNCRRAAGGIRTGWDVIRHSILATGEQVAVKLSERQVERLRGEILDALEGIERCEFPAKPEAHTCQGCPFQLICPA